MIADMDEISKPNSEPPITAMPLHQQSVSNALQSGKGLDERDEVNVADCVHGDGRQQGAQINERRSGAKGRSASVSKKLRWWESVQAYIA